MLLEKSKAENDDRSLASSAKRGLFAAELDMIVVSQRWIQDLLVEEDFPSFISLATLFLLLYGPLLFQ